MAIIIILSVSILILLFLLLGLYKFLLKLRTGDPSVIRKFPEGGIANRAYRVFIPPLFLLLLFMVLVNLYRLVVFVQAHTV